MADFRKVLKILHDHADGYVAGIPEERQMAADLIKHAESLITQLNGTADPESIAHDAFRLGMVYILMLTCAEEPAVMGRFGGLARVEKIKDRDNKLVEFMKPFIRPDPPMERAELLDKAADESNKIYGVDEFGDPTRDNLKPLDQDGSKLRALYARAKRELRDEKKRPE
jgi:hypothetical protein